MARVPQTADAAWPDLQRVFGLPDGCVAVNIRLRVNSQVMVTCMFASPVDGSLSTKRYALIELGPQDEAL